MELVFEVLSYLFPIAHNTYTYLLILAQQTQRVLDLPVFPVCFEASFFLLTNPDPELLLCYHERKTVFELSSIRRQRPATESTLTFLTNTFTILILFHKLFYSDHILNHNCNICIANKV